MKNGSKNDDDFFFSKKDETEKNDLPNETENIENGNEQDFRIKAIRNKTPFEEQQVDEEKEIKSFPLSEEAISETENGFKETSGKEENSE